MQNDSPDQLGHQGKDASFAPSEKDVRAKQYKVRNVVLSIAIFAGSILGAYSILTVVAPRKVAQSSVSTIAETTIMLKKGTIGSVEADIATDKKTEEQIDDSLGSQEIEDMQVEATSTQGLEGDYGDL